MRFRTHRTFAPIALVVALAGCNEEPDFGLDDWVAEVDTVTLYSVDHPGHQGLPSVYDLHATRTLRIEDPGVTGSWDFALTGGADQPLTLTPLGAFFDVENNAGVATVTDATFEELDSAPADADEYVTDASVAIETDVLYVIRSRRSSNCMNFAKLEPLELDQAAGTFTFRLTANPRCNDRDLVPPED
jgi:hypothetical protein